VPGEMIQEPVHLGDRVEVLAVATGVLHRQAVAVCAVADGRLLTWHLGRGELAAPPVVVGADGTEALAVGPLDGRLVAVCGTGRQVRVWDVAEAGPVGPALLGHDEDVTAVALGKLGGAPMVASGAVDGLQCVWDASSGEPLREPIQGQDGELVEAVLIDQLLGRDTLISTGWNDQVEAWDLASGSPVRTPAGSLISWRADDMEPIALGLAGGRPTALFTGEVEGPLIGTVEAVDVATGQVTGQLVGQGSGHAGAVRAGAFVTGAGRSAVITAGDDQTVRGWDLTAGGHELVMRWETRLDAVVNAVAAAPDGSVVAGGPDGRVVLRPGA
jgi:WD40 repeat protein